MMEMQNIILNGEMSFFFDPAFVMRSGLGGRPNRGAAEPQTGAYRPSGPNLERTYRMPGSEVDLAERGVILAGALSGQKARLRLLVGLALGRDARELFPVR